MRKENVKKKKSLLRKAIMVCLPSAISETERKKMREVNLLLVLMQIYSDGDSVVYGRGFPSRSRGSSLSPSRLHPFGDNLKLAWTPLDITWN